MRWVAAQQSRIQLLNDEFREAGPVYSDEGHWVMTKDVSALGPIIVLEAVKKVQRFDRFTEDNDPYGTHDFGAFEYAGERLFWKIDCYNRALDAGSPDDADPTVTCRVLTIMLASEY
jgi:hypothetical protein